MITIKSFVFNPLEENTYVVSDKTKHAVIIDPGCSDKDEEDELANYINTAGLTVERVINTHAHIDHVIGNAFVKHKYGVPLALHRTEEPYLRAVKTYAPNYGFFRYSESTPDEFLDVSDIVQVGEEVLTILFTPGHSPGHLAFYHEGSQSLISGDVLFYNSIGRTDLPGGDGPTLIKSIREKLFVLPDTVKVFPGHGPETTIGFEKRTNPFCAVR